MSRFLLLVCVIAVAGCALPPAEIYVDARFTTEERLAIQRAADTWETATHGAAHATFIWGYTLGSGPAGRKILVRTEVPIIPGAAGRTEWTPNDEHIYLDAKYSGFYERALHELGHHFTHCAGHLPSGNVMAPTWNEETEVPTAADVSYFEGACPS